ncbi:helix-turn-helix domain-containing protein [Cohnella sp. GCM10012308]|uniref:helix-turn-helix domain-containing protein n=1 Tax=Cohnella sp. GCM10012308 TaxID=3317329 RepID=UPI00361C7BC0
MKTPPQDQVRPAASVADGRLHFHLLSTDRRELAPGGKAITAVGPAHRLIVVEEGVVSLIYGDSRRLLARGAAALITPGSGFELLADPEAAAAWACLTFAAIGTDGSNASYSHSADLLIQPKAETAASADRTLRLLKRLARETDPAWRQLRFHELMLTLFAADGRSDTEASARVEAVIAAMQESYAEPTAVRDLASAADLPPHRFTAIFRQLTGSRPLDYLNELRIERAKDRLICSAEPLREIARLTGFKDEYYFSRRFRQQTGLTPRQYARSGLIRVTDALGRLVDIPVRPRRIVYHGETFGDLIALGAEAVGGAVFWEQRTVLGEHIDRVADVGWPIDPVAVARLGPDLVILACDQENTCEKTAHVAPTVAFNSFAPLDSRLLKLGELLGKRTEAESWLKSHRVRTDAMWRGLSGELQAGETATVFTIVRGGRLFVMGTIGLPVTLYHKSGFTPPAAVGRLLSGRREFAEIAWSELSVYAGDRIFLAVDEKEQESLDAARELARSEAWRSLAAVQAGRAYRVGVVGWNYGDALTSSMLLDKLPALLRQSS